MNGIRKAIKVKLNMLPIYDLKETSDGYTFKSIRLQQAVRQLMSPNVCVDVTEYDDHFEYIIKIRRQKQ